MKMKHDHDVRVAIPSTLVPGFAHIWSADLGKVARRLKKDHPFWSEAKIVMFIREYRKFLTLVLLSGTEVSMCNESVDEVWHTHLLFTRDYGDFCQTAFGSFLHHEPAGGEAEESDSAAADAFVAAYTRTFGQLDRVWQGSWWARASNRMLSTRLCLATGKAKLCLATGAERLCTASGTAEAAH